MFLVEAYFKLFATEDFVAEVAREWRRACPTQMTTALTVAVASSSWEWITDQVIGHPDVAHFKVERRPGESFDFEQAVRDA